MSAEAAMPLRRDPERGVIAGVAAGLARRLGIDEKEVRRLVDPRYRGSKVERLHAALEACGVVAQITLADSAGRERLLDPAASPGRGTPRPAAIASRRAG